MCGILCIVQHNCDNVTGVVTLNNGYDKNQNDLPLTKKFLQARGPDVTASVVLNNGPVTVELCGYVLWTQGAQPEPQPYSNSSRTRFLLFNGDLYGEHDSEGILIGKHHDGLHLFQRLEACSTRFEFLEIFSALEGPFAFVYYDQPNDELWFGRDFFGRQSLLVSYDEDDRESLIISSVSAFRNVFEVPTFGIYCYKISAKEIIAFQWQTHSRDQINIYFSEFKTFLEKHDILIKVDHSVQLKCIPTLLKSVSTDPRSTHVFSKLLNLCHVSQDEQLLQASKILESEIGDFLIHLRAAVRKRVKVQPPYCKHCLNDRTYCTHAKTGVLFSGGIDSTVLAYLAAECLCPGESLDLINVAFYQDEDNQKGIIPDRETGLASYELLKSRFPQLHLNFIPVNVPKSQIEPVRRNRIRYLLSPMASVLDDSVGCCLWFAASANAESTARILLLGSGADELLGGYSRFRGAYKNGGWEALSQAMQFDLNRISVRNLGRDNRIISDHGIAPRMPFLDESVVRFLTTECDLWVKCCPLEGLGRGVGEKLLLRATALTLLGNQAIEIALFPKRAMQFGSRIAKLENSKERGSDKCQRLEA